jgi:hypothetical protein
MTLKKCFLFCCVVSVYTVLQVGVYWGIVKVQASDSCPNEVPTTNTPCPFPEGAVLYNDCSESSGCTGYTAYSADTLNTGTKGQEGSESMTTSQTYELPGGYQCATYTICGKNLITQICEAHAKTKKEPGTLYTIHQCD